MNTKSVENKSPSVWLLIDSRGIGGIETHVLQLARALCDFEIDVEIVLMNDYGPHQLLFHSSRTPVRQLQGVRDLGIAMRRDRPSLVHTHGYKAGIVGRLVCRWNRVPVVSTFHSGDRGRGKLRFYTMLDELTAGLAPSIAVSGEIGNRLFARATVIPNFVAISPVRAAPRRERKIVAFVGRLSEEKGPEIFCRFADRLPSLEFHVFGDGPMRRELEASSNRPVFKGLVADMNLVWPNIDLLCITSRTEGLPLVALEAMSRGIPVAAFGVGGLPQLISPNTGWLVEPGNEPAFVSALEEFADASDWDLGEMGRAAQAVVRKQYSPEVRLPHILRVYGQASWRLACASVNQARGASQYCVRSDDLTEKNQLANCDRRV